MSLSPGVRFGPYEIAALLGRGGMGEVYRALDTRLERQVAIKVLATELTTDPQSRERFEREARTIAALEHPHICALYDVGEHDGVSFLVMPLLQGETLAERLKQGLLPIDLVLRYGAQLADALDAAHRAGVVHRDLKPGNVMITKNGVHLLDFGLARLAPISAGPAQSATTHAMGLTGDGALLGTVPYMAPEQLEGKIADARTDIFALGAVIYEMAAGRRPFAGDSPAGLVAAILREQPPGLASLRPECPAALDWVVGKCLAKEPDARWQSARDLADQLKWMSGAAGQSMKAHPATVTSPRPRPRAWLLSTLGVAVASGIAVWLFKPIPRLAPYGPTRFTIDLPEGVELESQPTSPVLAFSPDGRHLIYTALKAGQWQIFVRAVDAFESKPLAGAEGGDNPFVSPDGQWIGFSADGMLKKVSMNGGTPVTLIGTPDLTGATWSVNGVIGLAPSNRSALVGIPDSGGESRPLTTLDEGKRETSHRFPEFLPDGRALVFTAGPPANGGWYDAEIVAQSVDTGERRVLIHGAAQAHYVATGHLVYARAGSLYAVPFDAQALRVNGSAVKVLDGVSEDQSSGDAQFALSANGSLAYVPGGLRQTQVLQVDRQGHTEPLIADQEPRLYRQPRFSRDGRQIAISVASGNDDVWLFDLGSRVLNRFTSGANHLYPTWTPDGKRVAYLRSDNGTILWQPADRSAPPETILAGTRDLPVPHSWSPDSALLMLTQSSSATGTDVLVLRVADRSVQPVLQTRFVEFTPALSPDGHWLAYASDETGRFEIYLQPFPGPGPRTQISRAGGNEPLWAHNGKELFFREPADKLMVATLSNGVVTGTPRVLFALPSWTGQVFRTNYDVSPDDQQFVMIRSSTANPANRRIHVVLNWQEELKQRVPPR